MTQCLVIFDGGTKLSNPGMGYGSYQVSVDNVPKPVQSIEINRIITSNEAEWITLVEALLSLDGVIPNSANILVKGDSQLVIYQLIGKFQITSQHFRDYRQTSISILSRFTSWRAEWHPRSESVKIFGH